MSPELPFERHGGEDQVSALHNRIAALERIKYLTGIDLKDKNEKYQLLIDAELYTRYYKDEPILPIDEVWCKRVAEIVKELEAKDKDILKTALDGATDRVTQLYKESLNNIPDKSQEPKKEKKNVIISLFEKFLPKKV